MYRVCCAIPQAQKPAHGAFMKFLVDAHMPPSLCGVLRQVGHDAIHTSELPGRNRTTDATINKISMREQRVVISKDTDFYNSHLLHGEPWKLVIVRTGNIGVGELKALFDRHLGAIIHALDANSLVELDRAEIHIVV